MRLAGGRTGGEDFLDNAVWSYDADRFEDRKFKSGDLSACEVPENVED